MLPFIFTSALLTTQIIRDLSAPSNKLGTGISTLCVSQSDSYDSTGYFRIPENSPGNLPNEVIVEKDENAEEDLSNKSVILRVLNQMELAFDNLPPQEVKLMLDKLLLTSATSAQIKASCVKLIKLTELAEEIENAAILREKSNADAGFEDLYDAIRTVRSQIRMYGKDSDFCGDDGIYRPYEFKWPWEKR